ncbi:hypothetical protein N0V90_000981 [Kalmusia sp. IMI 367209]|nr:hypothetical protein N0V90_000981 [Kalmusia sp. IMI 367209]
MANEECTTDLDPLILGEATRQLIFTKSVKWNARPLNRSIRRAIGFRESKVHGRGKPVFASQNVTRLYTALDHIATHDLACINIEDFEHAWKRKTYTKKIEQLLIEHGERIWGDTIEQRQFPRNPHSQLLVANVDQGCVVDLFYERPEHWHFIALQLEHLAFSKAKRYFHNQEHKAQHPNPGLEDTEPSNMRQTRQKGNNSLVVVLCVDGDKLFAIQDKFSSMVPKKRKRNPDDDGRLLSNNGNEYSVDDEGRCIRRSIRNIRHDHNGERAVDGNDDEPVLNGESVLDGESVPDNESAEYDQGDEDHPLSLTSDEQPLSEERTRSLRTKLKILLYGELCIDDDDSHAMLANTGLMLAKSRELDNIMLTLWTRGEARYRATLGKQYERVNLVLHNWLSWREGVCKFNELTGVHFLEGKEVPQLTYEEWTTKLGGEKQFRNLDKELSKYWAELDTSGICHAEETEVTADILAWVFAAATNDTKLEKALRQVIPRFNEKLFSRPLQL